MKFESNTFKLNTSTRNTRATGGQHANDCDEDKDDGQPRGGQRGPCA